jgi:hypothetical protein
VPSTLLLACDDLARLVHRGLGERVRAVTCTAVGDELRFTLDGLDASRWLPRLRLEIAVTPRLRAEVQQVEARWRIVPSSWSGIVAGPAQHLGVGAKVVDALVERLDWKAAVVTRDSTSVVLSLVAVMPVQRLHLCVRTIAVDSGLRCDLSLGEACAEPGV